MKTVDKAFKVLDQFSLENTEVGLSDLSRMAELDKAATRRLLVALSKHGFVEQSSDTRKYRLGHGFLRLARIREATVPMAGVAQDVVDWLVETTDETVHISVPVNTSMATLAYRLPRRGNVINIVPAEPLFFHATSAGLAYLAFASDDIVKRVLELKREKVAQNTLTAKADLLERIKQTRDQGYAHNHNSFEDGVASVAKPFFLHQADPAGTVSIALPDANLTKGRLAELLPVLTEAVARIERALKGLST